MNQLPQRILLLAPHPDDGEFGCGATLARLVDDGHTVYYAAFSPCNKSLPEGYPPNTLYNELKEATGILGIPADHVITYDYPVREFPAYRQDILEELVKLKKEINPDLVFMPNSVDVHQDHHQIFLEGRRAFKNSRMLGYELPWNNLEAHGNFHIHINQSHLEKKWKAIEAYQSQGFRTYTDREFIFSLARVRGVQIQQRYAESFELIRWLI